MNSFIPNIGLFDIFIGIGYLFFIYLFAILYTNKKRRTNPEYKYFILGLTAKLLGGILFAIISIYYYRGGDTFVYYGAAEGLRDYFFMDFGRGLDVFFISAQEFNVFEHNFSPMFSYILGAEDVLAMVKITTIINFLSFGSYLVSSILFAFFSFLGLWFAYSNFCRIYPSLSKYMVIAFLLIPTALLWSSGILKDTVTQGAIGWMLYAFSNLFIFKRKVLTSILIILISSFLLFLLKPYILYVLLPCLFVWVQTSLKEVITNSFLRVVIKPILLVGLIFGGYFLLKKVSENSTKYSLDKIENTLKGFQSWHEYLSETRDQSGYSLGDMEFTPLGILKKAPAALNVTFFRPYVWEARNVPTLIGAIEGLVLFFYFIYLLITLRVRFFSIIFRNKEVFFMMLFAIIFGVIVGISSYNYGALSRYKIPSVMFFILSLILIHQQGKVLKNRH